MGEEETQRVARVVVTLEAVVQRLEAASDRTAGQLERLATDHASCAARTDTRLGAVEGKVSTLEDRQRADERQMGGLSVLGKVGLGVLVALIGASGALAAVWLQALLTR